MSQSWTAGPAIDGIRPALQQIRELLRGRLQVQDGVAIESPGSIQLNMRLVGDEIYIQLEPPMPQADVNYVFRLKRNILGLRISDNKLSIELDGLPDPVFEIRS